MKTEVLRGFGFLYEFLYGSCTVGDHLPVSSLNWSGRKDLNLRPPQPHCRRDKNTSYWNYWNFFRFSGDAVFEVSAQKLLFERLAQ